MVRLFEDTNIQAIADAIRAKNGSADTYKTSEMAAAVAAIPRIVAGDAACGLTHNNGTLTITGIETSKLKYIILDYNDYSGISTTESTKKACIHFDIDIANGTFDHSYALIGSSGGTAYTYHVKGLGATITVDEANDAVTVATNMTNAIVPNSTAGATLGWQYKAIYE